MKTHKGRCLGLTVLDIRPFIVLTGGVGALAYFELSGLR